MSQIKVMHNVRWIHYDEHGQVKEEGKVSNLILTDGLEILVDRMGNLGAQAQLRCIGIGDSDAAVNVSQTDLQGAELAFQITTNDREDSDKGLYYTTFAAGVGTGTIKETVLADTVAAKGARKCAARAVIGPIVKGAGDSVTIFWEFIFAQA